MSRSERFITAWASNADAARSSGADLCAASSRPVSTIGSYDALSLLAPISEWRTEIVPGLHRCAVDAQWVQIGPPPGDEDSFREVLRSFGADIADVEFNAVEVARFEATEAEWSACASEDICAPRAPAPPSQAVDGITPEAAESFCKWRGGHLPTLIEWHRAAQAGRDGAWTRFPWGNAMPSGQARLKLLDGPGEIGRNVEGSSPMGIEDLIGNVAEWVRTDGGHWHCLSADPRPASAPQYVLVGGGHGLDVQNLGRSLCKTGAAQQAGGGVRCIRSPRD